MTQTPPVIMWFRRDLRLSDNAALMAAVNAGAHLGIGFRVQFLDWMAAKFEYRQHFYGAQGGATSTPTELNFGLSFWTPGGEQ